MKEFFRGLISLIIISIILGILVGIPLYSRKCKAIKEYHIYDGNDVKNEELIYGEFPLNEYMNLNIIKNNKPIFNYELNNNFIDITMSPFALLSFYLIAPVIILFAFLFIIYLLIMLVDIIKKIVNKFITKQEKTYELGDKTIPNLLVEFPNDLNIYSILLLRFGHNYSIELKNDFRAYINTLQYKRPIDELYEKYIALLDTNDEPKTFLGIILPPSEHPLKKEIDDRFNPLLFDELLQKGYIINPDIQKTISSITKFFFKYETKPIICTSKGFKLKKELKKYEKKYLSKKDPFTYSPEENLYMTVLRNSPFI